MSRPVTASLALVLLGAVACAQGDGTSRSAAPERATATESAPPATRPAAPSTAGPRTDVGVARFEEIRARPGALVLDVRTPEEHAQGHVPGARNVDVLSPEFGDTVGELPRDATVLLYCHSGKRSLAAAEQMEAMGFERLVNLEGGFTAWDAAQRSSGD